jgi:hypothetical protein
LWLLTRHGGDVRPGAYRDCGRAPSSASSGLVDALDAAAGYIVAQKVEAIATLVGMAAAFIADQAAAVVTFGLSEAAVPLIIEGAQALVRSLVADLEQYVIGQVIEAAAKPLFAKVEAALSGLDWSKSGAAAGTPTGFSLDPGRLGRRQTCCAGMRVQLR